MTALTLTLTTDVLDLPPIGPRHADAFRAMGLRCVSDLLIHLPHRYEREEAEISIGDLQHLVGAHGASEVQVSTRGELTRVKRGFGRKPRLETRLEDDTGSMEVTFFNQPWLKRSLHPGVHLRVAGKVRLHGSTVQMVNPRWEIDDPEAPAPPGESQLLPIYPASEQVSSMMIARAMKVILDPAITLLDDHLPDAYRRERNLPRLDESYYRLHRPASEDEVAGARRRLAFDELLLLQLGVMMKRHHRIETLKAPALPMSEALQDRIRDRIPFTLTECQEQVVGEIADDLQRAIPMNRLLQGDVGSGKTVVGLQAMLMAVAEGHQAALLAPTELLAEQHAMSIANMLAGSQVRIALLTGSMGTSERSELLSRLNAGEIDIVIGTHALLSRGVDFQSLAVAIIDEQHRFGVHQRAVLRRGSSGNDEVPHQLVMTATPIPRTLSLTVFGDLDVSTIHGRLPGRSPVATRHVNEHESTAIYEHMAERVAEDQQGYIVVPVIDESESLLKDITTHLAALQSGPLSSCRLESMHGRMDRSTREEIMERFRRGDIDVLVSTTVIEVGIDVPNATMIVIEQADRFGLAQLHQLRGRVGRGSLPGLCVLVADPVTPDGEARLDAIVSTTDGFRIAEIDLEIRGPGELVGARQSGLPPFQVASLPRDFELLRMARRDAEDWIERDPLLSKPEHELIRRRLMKRHGEDLGLVDVG